MDADIREVENWDTHAVKMRIFLLLKMFLKVSKIDTLDIHVLQETQLHVAVGSEPI